MDRLKGGKKWVLRVLLGWVCLGSLGWEDLQGQAFRDTSATEVSVPSAAADVLKRPQDSLILGVNVDTESILVTAGNKKRDYITILKPKEFLVRENVKEQPISY